MKQKARIERVFTDERGRARSPLLLELTEVPLFLWDVPLSAFFSVGSAFGANEHGRARSVLLSRSSFRGWFRVFVHEGFLG